jgi:hypothetical protein
MVKHPYKKDTFAIWPIKYLKRLFGVPEDFYVGDSDTVARETIGQSVDCNFLKILFTSLRDFIVSHRNTPERLNNTPLGQQTLFA